MSGLKVGHKQPRSAQAQAGAAILVSVQKILDEFEQATGRRVCGVDIHMTKQDRGDGVEYPHEEDRRDKYVCDRVEIFWKTGLG